MTNRGLLRFGKTVFWGGPPKQVFEEKFGRKFLASRGYETPVPPLPPPVKTKIQRVRITPLLPLSVGALRQNPSNAPRQIQARVWAQHPVKCSHSLRPHSR